MQNIKNEMSNMPVQAIIDILDSSTKFAAIGATSEMEIILN